MAAELTEDEKRRLTMDAAARGIGEWLAESEMLNRTVRTLPMEALRNMAEGAIAGYLRERERLLKLEAAPSEGTGLSA